MQPIGINTIAKIPQKIAEYLKLPDSKPYTGHCLRRTSATLLADSGADILQLKRHGGWRSNAVAEAYVDDSINNKIKTSKDIFKEIVPQNTSCDNNCVTSNAATALNVEKQNNIFDI